MKKLYHLSKRILDSLISLCFLIIFSPLLLFLAIFIWISDGRPIIFKSQRIGKSKKIFTVYKFRTLVRDIERREDGLSPRLVINRLTDYMRDTHLDEVLQLINVIKGEMALIGPRPLDVPRYNHLYSLDSSWSYIFKIKPGMTCVNQIARYAHWSVSKLRKFQGLSRLERRNRLMLDKYYIKNESLWLDLKIVFWTVEYLVIGLFTKIFKKGEISL